MTAKVSTDIEPNSSQASMDDKSGVACHVDALQSDDISEEDRAFLRNFPADKKKKVLRKIDVRLIPLLTLLYLFAFIDRANIGTKKLPISFRMINETDYQPLGNAKIEGLTEDLKLTDDQYNTCLSIFFVPYVLFGQ